MDSKKRFENRKSVLKTIFPLKLVFWGAVLIFIDFNLFFFDVFNDTIGWIILASGIVKLLFVSTLKKFENGMIYVSLVLLLSVGIHFLSLISPELIIVYNSYLIYVSALQVVAIITFCHSMHIFCNEYELNEMGAHWKNTILLFTLFLIIPEAVNSLIIQYTHPDFVQSTLLLIILIIINMVLGLIPFVHVLLATNKMAKYAESLKPRDFSYKGAI